MVRVSGVTSALILMVALVPVSRAQEGSNGWRLKLGASYRVVSDIDFHARAITGAQVGGGLELNNSGYRDFDPGVVAIQDTYQYLDVGQSQGQVPVSNGALASAAYEVTATSVTDLAVTATVPGASDDTVSSGLILGAQRSLYQGDVFSCDLAIGLGVFAVSDSERPSVDTTGATYTATVQRDTFRISRRNVPGTILADAPLNGQNADGTYTPYYTSAGNDTASNTPVATGAAAIEAVTDTTTVQNDTVIQAKHSLRLDAYVLGIGPRLSWRPLDFLTIGLEVGPTLTIVEAKSTYRESVTIANIGASTVSSRESHKDSDAFIGLYAVVGLDVRVSSNVSLGLSYRYDKVAGTFETDLVEVDLDGHSGEAALTFSF